MGDSNVIDMSVDSTLMQIKQGDDVFLKELYERKRGPFISWFQKNHALDKQQAIDLFQKAFTILYFNIKDGKITTLKSSIDTYLFGIGKNLVKEEFRKRSTLSPLEDIEDTHVANYDIFDKEEEAHQKTLIKQILETLEEPCKTVLMLYYFKNLPMESIALQLGYKNAGVAKKKKCLCLKNIRDKLLQKKIER